MGVTALNSSTHQGIPVEAVRGRHCIFSGLFSRVPHSCPSGRDTIWDCMQQAGGEGAVFPWLALEAMSGQYGVASAWQLHLGEHFENFRDAFLKVSGVPAAYVPCPAGCGCQHEVVCHSDGRWTGICRCDSWNCPDLVLTAADVQVWVLAWARLGHALCRALQLQPQAAEIGVRGCRQIGCWAASETPAVFIIQPEPRVFHHAVADLIASLGRRLILLSPTTRHVDACTHGLLARAGSAVFSLERAVTLTGEGGLRANIAPGILFSAYQPLPDSGGSDEDARRVLALVKRIGIEDGRYGESLVTVFRLYCLEHLSAGQIARRCSCSKTTIINRLARLERHLGTPLKSLRAMAADFERLDKRQEDSRARRIHRRAEAELDGGDD